MQSLHRYQQLEGPSFEALKRSSRLIERLTGVTSIMVFSTGPSGDWRLEFVSGIDADRAAGFTELLSALPSQQPSTVDDTLRHTPLEEWPDDLVASVPLIDPTGAKHVGFLLLADGDSDLALCRDSTVLRDCADMVVEQLGARPKSGQASASSDHQEQLLASLSEREEHFRRVLDTVPHIVAVKDARGDFLMCNQHFAKIHGLRVDEVVGKNIGELVHPKSAADEILRTDAHVLETGEPYEFQMSVDFVGEERIVRTTKRRISDWHPGEDAVVSVVTDITTLVEREQQLHKLDAALANRERRFETLVNLLPLFIVVKDYDGHFLLSNQAHAATYNRSPEEMIGRHFFEFVKPRRAARRVLEVDREVIDTGEPLRTTRKIEIDEEEFIFDIMKIKYENWEPGVDAVLGIVTDITELKRHESEIDRQRAQLAELVDDLSQSNQQLEQFAYVASHDLQEPLRMITGFLSLLAEEYEGELDEAADEYIGYAVDGAKRMKAMINALLAYSRVRRNDDPFVPVDLDGLVEVVARDIIAANPDADVHVTCGELPTVFGRPDQLERLMTNLFSNAVKYAGARSVQIHVDCQPTPDEWIISVADSGMGISADQHERIFEVFVRGTASREIAGTGIGLAICNTIVEEHDGRIWVESEPAAGATFLFALPKHPKGSL